MGDRVSNMVRPVIVVVALLMTLNVAPVLAQESVSFKNFNSFKQVVPGVDFYASSRQEVTPYEKPVADVISRFKSLLGDDLPKGAIFICSSLAQKDSYYEPKVLKSGYSWSLMVTNSQVKMEEQLARMKSQMGNKISPELLERMKTRAPEMTAQAEKQTVTSTVQQMADAILQTYFNKDLQYKSSRLDDMGKSPLPDWLDIGITSYATGAISNLSFLQQHIDETFPIDDVLAMSRPFVVSSSDQGRGGGMGRGGNGGFGNGGGMPDSGGFSGMPTGGFSGMPAGGFSGMPAGGFGGMPAGGPGGQSGSRRSGENQSAGRGMANFGSGGGQRGGTQRNIPKDEQDRMLFEGQSSAFFAYLVERVGIAKVKGLIKHVQDNNMSREYLTQADVLGNSYDKVEDDWAVWVKIQKSQPESRNPGMF
jgi:hypothetical protein